MIVNTYVLNKQGSENNSDNNSEYDSEHKCVEQAQW